MISQHCCIIGSFLGASELYDLPYFAAKVYTSFESAFPYHLLSSVKRMFLKSITISCITSVLVSLPALAGDYSGKCFNQVAGEHDKCTISVSDEMLQLGFKKSPEATMSIPMSEIRAIEEILDTRVSAATFLVSSFARKKVHEFTVTYSDSEGRDNIASFRIKTKRAASLRADLFDFSGIQIDTIDRI